MAKLRSHIPVEEAIQRHEAGESMRSLAHAYGVRPSTLARHIKRTGSKVRSKTEAISLANSQRELPPRQPSAFYSQRHWAKKTKWLQDKRSENGCQKCGIKHPAVLEFHHRDPDDKNPLLKTKLSDNGKLKGRGLQQLSWKDLEAELEKCIVLCANCHRILHWER